MTLIVLDGIDGSGKHTQAEILEESLNQKGYKTKLLSFPRYSDDASTLIKRYLSGEYGENPVDLNPYAAGMIYAADRFDYFKKNNLDDYDVIICDRYTTSNMIHQASKLEDEEEKQNYINWLEDLEYNKLGVPEPDLVFYLNMPLEESEKLIEKRAQDEHTKTDIHERDDSYLAKAHNQALLLAQEKGWETIECFNSQLREIEDIAQEVLEKTERVLNVKAK